MPKVIEVKRKKRIIKTKPKFDLDLAICQIKTQDPVLAKLIKKIGPFDLKLEPIDSPFHALAESIVYQQLTGKAAGTIFSRVCALFDSPQFLCPHQILVLPEDILKSAGLSRSKLASIKDLAEKAVNGFVPEAEKLQQMSDEEIIDCLTTIRGIGRWTVEMMLIFRLGRLDVWPVHDYGIRKGFSKVFGCKELPKPKELEAYGERWRPYRTIVSWYLWRSLD